MIEIWCKSNANRVWRRFFEKFTLRHDKRLIMLLQIISKNDENFDKFCTINSLKINFGKFSEIKLVNLLEFSKNRRFARLHVFYAILLCNFVEFVNLRLLAKFGCSWKFKKTRKNIFGTEFCCKKIQKNTK